MSLTKYQEHLPGKTRVIWRGMNIRMEKHVLSTPKTFLKIK